MTIWFYGDSWPDGCELHHHKIGMSDPSQAFPVYVGEIMNTNIVNKSREGTSQESMIDAFLDSDVQPNDLAIFCCTAKTRRVYRSPTNQIVNRQYNHDETYVNPYEDERVSSRCLALLYYMSKARGVIPYFFNEFDSVRYGDPMYAEIPENHWLIPIQESIVSWLFDPEYFHQWDHHHNGNFRDWLDTESNLVKKFIRPCIAHPNITGHQHIARFIADELTKRGHNN